VGMERAWEPGNRVNRGYLPSCQNLEFAGQSRSSVDLVWIGDQLDSGTVKHIENTPLQVYQYNAQGLWPWVDGSTVPYQYLVSVGQVEIDVNLPDGRFFGICELYWIQHEDA